MIGPKPLPGGHLTEENDITGLYMEWQSLMNMTPFYFDKGSKMTPFWTPF